MKRFKFEMGGSYTFYFGYTLGRAILAFQSHRPERVEDITNIIELPMDERL